MNFLLRHPFSVGLLAISLSSCAPTVTTYQLEPISGDVATIDGRPVTKTEQNGVGIVASYEQEDMAFVSLDVEIKNYSNHSITINPADFRFTALDSTQTPLLDPYAQGQSFTRNAADPVYEASRINLKRKQEEKRLKRAKIFNTVLLIAAVASDVSSSSRSQTYRDYTNNRVAHGMAYQGIAIKRTIDYTTFANRMQQYDYEEYRWRELALKSHTLAPGETVRGFIYLPKVAVARFLSIQYILPEQATVSLLFSQRLMQQKKSRSRS